MVDLDNEYLEDYLNEEFEDEMDKEEYIYWLNLDPEYTKAHSKKPTEKDRLDLSSLEKLEKEAEDIEDLTNSEFYALCAAMETSSYDNLEEYLEENPESIPYIREGRYTYIPYVRSYEELGGYYKQQIKNSPKLKKLLKEYLIDENDLYYIGVFMTLDKEGSFTSYGWFNWEM